MSVAVSVTVTFWFVQVPKVYGLASALAALAVVVGASVSSITVMVNVAVASAKTPSDAVTVNVYMPAVVGMPDSTPAALSVRPGGRSAGGAENVPGGEPVLDVNVWLYDAPTSAGEGGAGAGVAGAAPSWPSKLVPQQVTVPSVLTAQVKKPPALMAVTVPVPGGMLVSPGAAVAPAGGGAVGLDRAGVAAGRR